LLLSAAESSQATTFAGLSAAMRLRQDPEMQQNHSRIAEAVRPALVMHTVFIDGL
jgi:hypothetical protein